MTAYRHGSTPHGEMAAITEAYARAAAAIRASPNPRQAFREAKALHDLTSRLSTETTGFQAQLAAELLDANALSLAELAAELGVSKSRAAQLVTAGRQKGTTVTDPGTQPEPPSIALAIITRGRSVLIEHRVDLIPPWSFPSAEIRPGESPAAALARRVPEKLGIHVTPLRLLGRRIFPRTGRVLIYLSATVSGAAAALTAEPLPTIAIGAPEDLDDARWATVEETRDLMPDMFPPVRNYLDALNQEG